MTEKNTGRLEIIASKEFTINKDLVYVVDFLNKNLKNRNIMFGLNQDNDRQVMHLSIYEFE